MHNLFPVKIRNLTSLGIIAVLLTNLMISQSFAADKNKYLWPPQYNNEETLKSPLLGYAFNIVDDFTQGGPAAMEAHSFISVSGNIQPTCTSFFDPFCINEINAGRGDWWSNVAIAICKSPDQATPCIEALRIVENANSANSVTRNLVLKKVLPGNYWPAEPSINLPEGSAPTLWIDPLENNKSKGYLLAASGALNSNNRGAAVTRVNLTTFQASISPYEQIQEPGVTGASVSIINGIRKFGAGAGPHCIWADKDECGLQSEFKENTRLQLVLHLPTQISTWLLGRMQDPVISVEQITPNNPVNGGISRVTVTANSTEIPLIAAKTELSAANEAQRKWFGDPKNNMGNSNFPNDQRGYNYQGTSSSYPLAFDFYEMFKTDLPTNAQLMLPRWSVRSFQFSAPEFSRCQGVTQGKFQGVVTTNASIYQGSPPTFDGDSFDYKVAGVHRKTNGEIFQGSYDLILDSRFARCLYRFSSAPVKASVSITNVEGSSNIATSTFNEKDGWMKLSINGFTFSSPKISVKLEQEKVIATPTATPTPSPSPSVTATAAASPTPTTKPSPVASTAAKSAVKKSTIVCVKGKVTKKVTAMNPKCPAGYRKK